MNVQIFATVFAGVCCLTGLAQANDLTVSGPGAPEGGVVFSLDALDAMEQSSITTTNIWTDGPVTFSGVSLSDILAAANVSGASVTMVTLNDYAASLPMVAVDADYPLVATRLDGQEMSVREKGPYRIVYPYDSDPMYQTETIYAQSVWQLRDLVVTE